jgi:2-hydroxychromene-2-carboxylate isomerase
MGHLAALVCPPNAGTQRGHMKQIDFYFDFISPFAYLAFEHLPSALEGSSYQVNYRPVLFAGMLKHHGQLGPAEIAPKRVWTYRHVLWLAKQHGIELLLPAQHPFNPLAYLRLAYACSPESPGEVLPNRWVCETIFRQLWATGQDAASPTVLSAVSEQLRPLRVADSAEVKDQLRLQTQQALSLGAFGVPTFVVQGELFWGFDALPLMRSQLLGNDWIGGPAWQGASKLAVGTDRPR